MGRQAADEAVSAIQPFDEQEVADRTDVRDWIASGADLFRVTKPNIPPKHLVSYFALVDPVARSVLLVDHRNAQLWLPTGGHVEPGEDPLATVHRETREELGIDAVLMTGLSTNPLFVTVTTTGGLDAGHVDVSLWYVLDGRESQELTPDPGEFAGSRWWSLEAIERGVGRIDPNLPRFARKLSREPRFADRRRPREAEDR